MLKRSSMWDVVNEYIVRKLYSTRLGIIVFIQRIQVVIEVRQEIIVIVEARKEEVEVWWEIPCYNGQNVWVPYCQSSSVSMLDGFAKERGKRNILLSSGQNLGVLVYLLLDGQNFFLFAAVLEWGQISERGAIRDAYRVHEVKLRKVRSPFEAKKYDHLLQSLEIRNTTFSSTIQSYLSYLPT